MPVVLEGSLHHFGSAELLEFLTRRGGAGTLELESRGGRINIVFRDRTIVAVSGRGGDPKTDTIEALGWRGGTFRLVDSAAISDGFVRVTLDVVALLEEAQRAQEQLPYRPDAVIRLVDDPANQKEVSLGGLTLKLLSRLGEPRTFEDLASALGAGGRELAQKLEELERLGLVAVENNSVDGHPVDGNETPAGATDGTLMGALTAHSGEVHPLLDDVITLGRIGANAVAIADPSVSSSHARIARTSEGFVVEDLQSRNGTFVNAEKVTGPRTLADGDLLRLGRVVFTFNIARPPTAADETLTGRRSE